MYCPSCGKETPENSRFCLHCGKLITAPNKTKLATPVQWEYKDYVYTWKRGATWANIGNKGLTLAGARLEFWSGSKREIEYDIQKWLDNGWELIGEVDPSNIETREYSAIKGTSLIGKIILIVLAWPTLGLVLLAAVNRFSEPTVLRVQMRRLNS
jgi:hypothetical protein